MGRLATIFGVLIALLVGAALLSGPAPRADFVFLNRGDVSTLDPSQMSWMQDFRVATLLYEGLTRRDVQSAGYDPLPGMAERWEVSPDGLVYTFHLRPATWTNGDPVTAHDFEWSFKRQLDPATQASYAAFLFDLKNAEAFNTKKEGITADDVGAKAIDDLTLEITLEGPRGYFLTVLAYTAALPAHRGAVEKFGDKWTEPGNIVTNGPWKLTEWEHEKQLVAIKIMNEMTKK